MTDLKTTKTAEPTPRLAQVTSEESGLRRSIDLLVGFRILAVPGSLIAAIAPAVMATNGGCTLRGSVSAYWNLGSDLNFEVPFTLAAALLGFDGLLSYVSPNKNIYGRRWFNVVLGLALFVLTWFNTDDEPTIHLVAAVIFFALFIGVILYTTVLGWFGRLVPESAELDQPQRELERANAQVAAAFLGLLALTLIAFAIGVVSFFFFEVFALVNFALFYVQGLVRPFPYRFYEFPWAWLNGLLRWSGIMPDAERAAAMHLAAPGR